MFNHFFDRLVARGDNGKVFLEAPGRAKLSYTDLRAGAARVANALAAMGVVPGDRVAAQVEKSPEALILYLGVVRVGGIFLPLNTAYGLAELDYFLKDAEPKLLVCEPARFEALAPVAARAGVSRVVTLDAEGRGTLRDKVDAADAAGHPAARSPDDLAAILYTSGTTGRAKGAMLTHGNLVSNAEALADIWHFTPGDRLLHALPIYHVYGLFVATNTVLAAGASLILLPRFDVDAVLAAMQRATVMMGVPTFFTRLLDRPELTRDATAHMRLFVSGSAPLLAETHSAWSKRTDHAILERYGMTETSMSTSNPYAGERRAGTVGVPLPDVEARIVDDDGAVLGCENIGMIEVKGPNVFKGYWRNPAKTAEAFRGDGFFVTGDLGKIDADGYVHIVGRGKDLVISGGLNVYPKEVELEIDALSGVRESAVIGLPHADFGEAVAAVVVCESGAAIDEAVVKAGLQSRLAGFKQPKRVFFVDELPRNTMGKVQKAALRDIFKDAFAS